MKKTNFGELVSDTAVTGVWLFLGGSVICIPFVGFGPLLIALLAIAGAAVATRNAIDKEKRKENQDDSI